MARIPTRGSTIATPCRPQSELAGCLSSLGVKDVFDEDSLAEVYLVLGEIVGWWMAEEGRLNSGSVANSLIMISRQLDEISTLLAAHETGLHNAHDIEVVSQLAEHLSLDPTIGSMTKAKSFITGFVQRAKSIAHSCLVAGVNLRSQAGSPGRSSLRWYDDFTALLLEIADRAGVRAASKKDRITGKRSGWLFDAATIFETFLRPEMRSPSPEARGQRLDRSLRRLRARQKPSRSV
jgi:hypothetical protein